MLDSLIYDDGSHLGFLSTRICIAFTALSFLFVALRIYTRAIVVRNIGPEDWTVLFAWICSLLNTVFSVLQVYYGNGHHVQSIKPESIFMLLRSLWISILFYQTGLCLTKFSILWQYYRIFPSLRKAVFVMIAITVAYLFWSVFDNAFACRPVSFFWDKSIVGGHCAPQSFVWFSNASINIATDIIIFLMPLPALYKLQIPQKQKVGLLFVFALGGLVCVVSILRLPELAALIRSQDPTYDNVAINYWTDIEINVAVICACLPSLKAFAARYLPNLLGNSSKGTVEYTNTHTSHGAPKSRLQMSNAFDQQARAEKGDMNIEVTTVLQVEDEKVNSN